ncbi:hypothetical protein F4780DRAFT_783341 [Xylariomycetidae sp. FL0641]|nr:hypothetical protein F4780DRAFT_783341 [Xylariomycetidae sp. FL0641]
MYSRDETVSAVLGFYQEVTRHPYLESSALILPPTDGWGSIRVPPGKSGQIHDLLSHLPYLRASRAFQRLLVSWETVPICYADGGPDSWHSPEENYRLPAHCINLTQGVGREGMCLILDVDAGTVTEFSHADAPITIPYDEYENLPEEDRWRAHVTTPVVDFFTAWTHRYRRLVWMLTPNPVGQPTTGRFYNRADSRAEEEELARSEQPLLPWHPRDDDIDGLGGTGSALDQAQVEARRRARRHAADVYNTYLRHGWLGQFDQSGCRAELLDLERQKDAEERKLMDEANPDKALFD